MSRELNIGLIREACRADKKTVWLDEVLNAIVEKKHGMRRICDLYRQACVRKSQDPALTWDMDHDVLEEQRDEVLEMFAITLQLIPLPDWLAPKPRVQQSHRRPTDSSVFTKTPDPAAWFGRLRGRSVGGGSR